MNSSTPLTAQLARALIRSLNRGTAVTRGARFIHVGQRQWLAAQMEVLDEVAEDGHAETKFVRGTYGAGKSHFLSVVQDFARERNWATSHIECKTDSVEIDRFETLYPRIVAKLLTRDLCDAQSHSSVSPDPAGQLLDIWSKKVMKRAGIRENALSRPFDADQRVYAYFERELFRSNLPAQFVQVALTYCRAALEGDLDTATAVLEWLKGGSSVLQVPVKYVSHPKRLVQATRATSFRPLGKGTAHEAMRGLLWLIRDAGYAGLVLCIDEVEELARLSTQRRRDQALQALREFVDHAGGEGGYRSLCMYLAATPEMFDSDQYFPRYDALATRIQPLGDLHNWRGPIIDLEKFPLSRIELCDMAEAIVRVHEVAYGRSLHPSMAARVVESLVSGAISSRMRLAKPRLLARMLVDELEKARSEGSAYSLPMDPSHLASRAATAVLESERA